MEFPPVEPVGEVQLAAVLLVVASPSIARLNVSQGVLCAPAEEANVSMRTFNFLKSRLPWTSEVTLQQLSWNKLGTVIWKTLDL